MLREEEIKERALNAGYQVEDDGGNTFTVAEPHLHWTTPHQFVIFTKGGACRYQSRASSLAFKHKLFKDIDYYQENE